MVKLFAEYSAHTASGKRRENGHHRAKSISQVSGPCHLLVRTLSQAKYCSAYNPCDQYEGAVTRYLQLSSPSPSASLKSQSMYMFTPLIDCLQSGM